MIVDNITFWNLSLQQADQNRKTKSEIYKVFRYIGLDLFFIKLSFDCISFMVFLFS